MSGGCRSQKLTMKLDAKKIKGLDRTEAEMGCWWIVGEGVWCAVGCRIMGRGKERCIICIG
jgi:hypothetical protein